MLVKKPIQVLVLALSSGLAIAVSRPAFADGVEFLEAPIHIRTVEEFDLPGNSIQFDTAHTFPGVVDDGNSVRIELGPGGTPHSTSLGPTFAQAYSAFNAQTQTSTYWASVNDYPGSPSAPSPYNSGLGKSTVQLFWHMQKLADDATVTLHVTGGRLQLVDYSGRDPLSAQVRLHWNVYTDSVDVSSGDSIAVLTGHAGTLGGSETFNYTSQGFVIGSYTEQRDYYGLNVVGATLDIPAQDIAVNIDQIIPFGLFSTGEFKVSITLEAQALALYGDGGAASAFLRDPVSMGQSDPELGGSGISYTGITVLAPAPVPEPSNAMLFLAGSGLLGWLVRRRRLRGDQGVVFRSNAPHEKERP